MGIWGHNPTYRGYFTPFTTGFAGPTLQGICALGKGEIMIIYQLPDLWTHFGPENDPSFQSCMSSCWGLNSHCFHIIGDGKINPIVGFIYPL